MTALSIPERAREIAARTVRCERDANNGANLHAVFLGTKALHHFNVGNDAKFTKYVADVRGEIQTLLVDEREACAKELEEVITDAESKKVFLWAAKLLREGGQK